MAVVRMNRITILGLKKERSSLLESLQKLGVVEIKQEQPDEEIKDRVHNSNVQNELMKIDTIISDFERALTILDSYVPVSKPMFSSRRAVSEAEYSETMKSRDEAINIAKKVILLEEEVAKIRSEENRLNNLSASLTPWVDADIPLNVTGTHYTVCLMGTIPATYSLDNFSETLSSQCPESVLIRGIGSREHHYIAIIAHKAIEADILSLLRNYGFNRISLREVEGTAREGKEFIQKRLADLSGEREKRISAIKELAGSREMLEVVSDGFRMERARIEGRSRLLSTRSVFLLKGWLPAELSDKVKEYISENYFCAIEIEEPGDDEEYPVLLQNGSVVESISPVINMYGLPSSKELDPSAFTMPFFIFFFGLMLGDGGYGILMALITGFILKKYKLEESTRRFFKLLFYCGLSSILAGFLFGSWFGIASLTKTALWIVPTEQPELMMSYSILLGIIHMYTGMFVKALNFIRRKQYIDAICDVFFVYIMLTGFVLTLLPYAPGISVSGSSSIVKTGNYMFLIGAILVVVTQGRNSKNIFGKLFGGLPKLYDIVGFFGDCLSYIRILALGLASAIIGDIVNTLTSSFGGFILVKILTMTLVLVIGHLINFLLNALGAYVHSCRLQYLEFFGKFLEGGGEAFKPFKAETKYILVNNEISELFNTRAKSRVA